MSLSEYDRGYIKGCKDMGDELDEYAIARELWDKWMKEWCEEPICLYFPEWLEEQ